MIGNAVGAGYQVLVVDGSPDHVIRQALEEIGAIVRTQTAQGMGGSRRELFTLGSARDGHFLWLEPEKVDLIRSIPEIIAPIENGTVDIVIPSRTKESWASYPAFQVDSEKEANAVYMEVTGCRFDPMFGPVAFNSKAAPYFAKCDPPHDFGITDGYVQHFAPLKAMKAGCNVVSVPVDFYYPLAQRVEEETGLYDEMRLKRSLQLERLSDGYRLAAKYLNLAKA